MARIKVCPKCYTKNPSSNNTCLNCELDIFKIKAIDEKKYEQQLLEQQEKAQEQKNKQEDNNPSNNIDNTEENNNLPDSTISSSDKDNNQNNTNGKLIKICPKCKTENQAVAKVCTHCNANIKYAQKRCKQNDQSHTNIHDNCQSTNNTNRVVCTLSSPDNKYSFNILESEPIITIGREHKMKEYLAIRSYVSREHAKIEIIGSNIAIVDLGKVNGIFINNIKVESNSKAILKDGDKVSLGGRWPNNFEEDNTGCFIVNYSK